MKKLLMTVFALTSFQAMAIDFTSITVPRETVLERNEESGLLYHSVAAANKSDYCSISLESRSNEDLVIIPAGTTFEVLSITVDECEFNRTKKTCSLELLARNQGRAADLTLECTDKGLFAKKLKADKINKITNGLIIIR
jgi:hypothetical protein